MCVFMTYIKYTAHLKIWMDLPKWVPDVFYFSTPRLISINFSSQN